MSRRPGIAVLALSISVLAAGHSHALLSATVQQTSSAPARTGNLIVAPDGRANNPGTARQPLDLATALSKESPAGPGDTIWLRGGTYKGAFESYLTGSEKEPIVVRQVPGERAVIDGGSAAAQTPTLTVWGAHAWYWGFEVGNSEPDRAKRGTGLQIYGPNTRFINLVVHGTGNGFGVWADAIGAELYGNLIYDNGWDAADRGHGHSIYVQNQTGVKRIIDNVLFDSYSFGVHAYTEKGYIDNLHIEGNIAFNHGSLSKTSGPKANIMVGGYRTANDPVIISNYTYYPVGSKGRNADVGYIVGCRRAKVVDNYLIGGAPLVLTSCQEVEVKGNTFFAPDTRDMARQFPLNTYLAQPPSTPSIIVRPNRYEPGRAQVAIYNWTRQAAVTVALAAVGLKRGEAFEIRDAQNYFGEPVLRGRFAGKPVRLPMTASGKPGAPAGSPGVAPRDFGAFIVMKSLPRGQGGAFVAKLRAPGVRPRPAR